MNTILSFCKLDLLKLINGSRFTLIAALLSLTAVFFAPANTLLFFYFYMFLSYSIALTLISLDEQYHSSYLCSALPSSRKNIVTSRFIFYFIVMTALSVLYLILGYISPFGQPPSTFVFWINCGYGISLIYIGLIQALCYRFKYSSVRMIAILSFCLLISVSTSLKEIIAQQTPLAFHFSPTLPSLIVTASGLVIFAVCLFIGQALYHHKDIKD